MVAPNLDMDVLRTLVVATDLRGFMKAAVRLGRTQSAISLQMKKLEDQIGQPLFRKNGRGVALTDAGDVLLGYARRILTLNDEAIAATRGVAVEGTVRLGLPQDLAERWLPNVLGRFHRTHPHIHLEAHVGRGRDLREQVSQGGLDIALAFGEINAGKCQRDVLAHVPLAWIGAQGYKLPADGPLPLALLDAPCMFRQHGIGLLDDNRRPWRIVFTSPSLTGLWGALEAGLGVTIRTPVGLPPSLAILDSRYGLPPLATVPLALHLSPEGSTPAVERLQSILVESLYLSLPPGTVFPNRQEEGTGGRPG